MTLRKLLPIAAGVILALLMLAFVPAEATPRHNNVPVHHQPLRHKAPRNLDPCPSPLTGKDASGTSQNFATQNDASNNCVGESSAYQAVQFSGTLQSSAVANGNGTALSTTGLAGATMTVNCASCSGGTTVNFEAQEDGSDFVPLQGTKLDGSAQGTTVTTAGLTIWQFNLSGVQQIRARISGYSAGTVTVTAHAIAVPAHYPTMGALQTTSPWTVGGSVASGSSNANNPLKVGGAFNTTQPTVTNGQIVDSQYTSRGAAIVATGIDTFNATINAGTNVIGKAGIDQTTPGTTNAVQPIAGTAGGCTPYHLANGSAASNNSTSVKGSAGNLCDIEVINTTSAIYYLKLYDNATAPTCSSATNLKHVYPIPNNIGSGAGMVRPIALGETYSNGIGFCLTGGGADTDNTSAATGVWIEGSYK